MVDFDGVRLRAGYAGQAATQGNAIPLQGEIHPGEYAIFNTTSSGSKLNLTNSGAFVWLEYVHGVKIYDNTIVEYPDSSSKKGQSWAMDTGGAWRCALQNPTGGNLIKVEKTMS